MNDVRNTPNTHVQLSLFRVDISLRFSFLFSLFLFRSASQTIFLNERRDARRGEERTVPCTLLRDRYEWRWRTGATGKLLTQVSFTYVLLYVHLYAFSHGNSTAEIPDAFGPALLRAGRMRSLARSRSANNGPRTRKGRRARVNYSARIITVANKSFITLLCCVPEFGGGYLPRETKLT